MNNKNSTKYKTSNLALSNNNINTVEETSKPIFISQEKNYANKHGFHYRSSAQFYFEINKKSKLNTSLILFNYFQIKNNNKVAICVTLRNDKGEFIDRRHIDFTESNVIIINRQFWGIDNHYGSVEVEYYSLSNLVIPYAAVIGVYETSLGISYIHTYSRCYSTHELETGFTVMDSCESNWTIRDSNDIESFTVIHNGFLKNDEQTIKIKITTESGRIMEVDHKLKALNPYEIFEVVPQAIIENLASWLENEQANCSIKFKINGGFTRTLVGNRTKSKSDMQVTHSNFAYNYLKTDFVNTKQGYMPYPNLNVDEGQVNIYPDMPSGEYFFGYDYGENNRINFNSGQYISHKVKQHQNFNISLGKINSDLPSRIPIGFSGKSINADKDIIPYEISLGICTIARPRKRFWWGPIGNNQTNNSLVIGLLSDIYGKYSNEDVIVRIYNDKNNEYEEIIISSEELISNNFRIDLEKKYLKAINNFGMYTVFSEYPGFFIYSLTENSKGSVAIEHGF